MQPKLIKSILAKKLNAWAKTVETENKEVATLIRENTIVMGGSICSMLDGETPNDYDVYFRTHEAAKKIAHYYMSKFHEIQKEKQKLKGGIPIPMWLIHVNDPKGFKCFIKSAGVVEADNNKAYQYFETENQETVAAYFGTTSENEAAAATINEGGNPFNPESSVKNAKEVDKDKANAKGAFRPVYITQNAITLSDDVQIVTRFYGEPEEILEFYDYEHCKMYYKSWDRKLEITVDALESLHNKRLVYTGSRYPVCSLFRMRKFMSRGWSINAGQIVKMAWQIHKLDLNNIEVLSEQLIGVDHAYFVEILELLKAERKKLGPDADKSVNGTYLMTLIDKFF